jgi:5-(carboxyamino)imidazole ribonucleotide mutase
MQKPIVGIIMGSDSDLQTMSPASVFLTELEISHEIKVMSAHRTPLDMIEYGSSARERGLKVIIAGAGGAAHLPGMIAATTELPVIGVPVKSSSMSGTDSLYSIVQMPAGVPVATVAIGGGKNAGILAAQILATSDENIMEKIINYKKIIAEESRLKNDNLAFGTFEFGE